MNSLPAMHTSEGPELTIGRNLLQMPHFALNEQIIIILCAKQLWRSIFK